MRRFAAALVIVGSFAVAAYAAQSAVSNKGAQPAARPTLAFADSFVYPHLWLKNDSLVAKVYIPDSRTGFYRGTRFNWSGMVGELQYRGHRFFQHWDFPAHTPDNPEHGIGPADEFDMASPPGFDSARVGGKFMKIGVGVLVKTGDRPDYFFNQRYSIADTGKWTVTLGENTVTYQQSLALGAYAYRYTKRLSIEGTSLVIHHELTNTGTAALATVNYSHNFFIIDGDTAGPSYCVEFGAKPAPVDWQVKGIAANGAKLDSNVLTFTRTFVGGSLPIDFPKPIEGMQQHLASVYNLRTGAVATLGSDVLPVEFRFWSANPVCPEPFIRMDLKPGQTGAWATRITFSEIKPATPKAAPKKK